MLRQIIKMEPAPLLLIHLKISTSTRSEHTILYFDISSVISDAQPVVDVHVFGGHEGALCREAG